MSLNGDLENLPSARKLADLNKIYAPFADGPRLNRLVDYGVEQAYLAGKKRAEWEQLRMRSRTAKPSRAVLRKMAALRAESQELCDRIGLQVEWPEE